MKSVKLETVTINGRDVPVVYLIWQINRTNAYDRILRSVDTRERAARAHIEMVKNDLRVLKQEHLWRPYMEKAILGHAFACEMLRIYEKMKKETL